MSIAAVSSSLVSLPTLPTTTTPGVDTAGPVGGVAKGDGVGAVAGADPTGGFADMLVGALDEASAAQSKADSLAKTASTGSLTDVHDYMIASTEASLATELVVAVRDKGVEAFNSIMQMPV